MHRRAVLLVAVTVGLMTGGLVAAAPAAVSATPVWTVAKSPNPPPADFFRFFSGVSCSSPTNCFAVGSSQNVGGAPLVSKTLVEHWNGKTWAIQTSPNPSTGSAAVLSRVSCPSPSSCYAVGYTSDQDSRGFVHYGSLAESWNGKTWAIQPSPSLPGSFLRGVSCTSATDCYAVGSYGDLDSKTLVEHWNGKTWEVQASPNPPDASASPDAYLGGVSCTRTTNCYAVGSFYNNVDRNNETLVEHWNGKAWAIQSSPNPTKVPNVYLADVSCADSTHCMAVGSNLDLNDGTAPKTLIEHWNGKTWTISTSAGLAAALTGVSCPSRTRCYAVGASSNSARSFFKTLVEVWDGHTWATQTSPNPTTFSPLYSVSCPGVTNCYAVGYTYSNGSFYRTLVERYA